MSVIPVAITTEMCPPLTMSATIGMRMSSSALLNVNDFANRAHTPDASPFMSWKTKCSCSRKFAMIVTSEAMIAATR